MDHESNADLARMLLALTVSHSAAVRRAAEANQAARSLAQQLSEVADQIEGGHLREDAEVWLEPNRARRISEAAAEAWSDSQRAAAEILQVTNRFRRR